MRREVSRSSGARSNFHDCFLRQTWDSESGGHAPIREGYGANKCRPQSPRGAWAAPASEPKTHPVHEGVLDVASGLLPPRKPKPRRLEDAVVPVDEVHLVLSVNQHHVPERPENALQPRSTARGDSLRGKVLQPNAPRSKHWGLRVTPPAHARNRTVPSFRPEILGTDRERPTRCRRCRTWMCNCTSKCVTVLLNLERTLRSVRNATEKRRAQITPSSPSFRKCRAWTIQCALVYED